MRSPQVRCWPCSAKTGDGLQDLRQTLLDIAGWQAAPEGVFIARQRHVQALRTARAHLEAAQAHAALNDGALDLLAEELRLTHNALGTITGAFSADDLLGRSSRGFYRQVNASSGRQGMT